MELNYVAIVVATVLQFIWGWVWYMPVFGKAWGEMHGFNALSKEDQAKAGKEMFPLLSIQCVTTFLTTFVLALFTAGLPSEWNPFGIAGFFWIGFVVPTQVSAVLFGGTAKEWVVKKIAIMAGGSLVSLLIAAAVLHAF